MNNVQPVDVHFVLLPDSLILDWAGPAEALRVANQVLAAHGQTPIFRLHFHGPQARLRSSVGAWLADLEPLPALAAPDGACHWVMLVGQPGDQVRLDHPDAARVLDWLRGLRLDAGRLELVCVCAGAVIAGHAGLLKGRRATSHHHHLDELRRVAPDCDVVPNRVFVLDGPVSSSAGVTTGIDLTLHRIAGLCGPALAAQVAQTLVVALRRGPQDPELSPFLSHRNHLHPALHRVQDAVSQAPQDEWTVPRMADVACTSARHLARLFAEHAGIAPLAYLRQLRLALASAALHSGLNVTQAAALAGFHSDTQLRRAWREAGQPGSPSQALRSRG